MLVSLEANKQSDCLIGWTVLGGVIAQGYIVTMMTWKLVCTVRAIKVFVW
jgi:hypothetical protein